MLLEAKFQCFPEGRAEKQAETLEHRCVTFYPLNKHVYETYKEHPTSEKRHTETRK
jgi:hypothetical protein